MQNVERFTLDVPYRPRCGYHLSREIPHWGVTEICKVTLSSGVVGHGETIVNYTWGRVSDESVERVKGKNPFDLLWDDSLGAGLQMAVWDAAGREAGVPCHRLMGRKVRDWAPISWWCIDMPPADWVAECQDALGEGYMSVKVKGRPWFDILDQVDAIHRALPRNFKIDVDFNGTLNDAGRAIPVLQELDRCPNVTMYESPINQGDVEGNKLIRAHIKNAIAHHYGWPPIMTALREQVCDGFVIGGGAAGVVHQGTVAATAEKPFWLQLVGTGLTTTFAMHLGAVLTHARWPAITCLNIYSDDLLAAPLEIQAGQARVPGKPGLGIEVDEAAFQKFRVTPPVDKSPGPRVYSVVWEGGRRVRYGACRGYYNDFTAGNQPVFERGVTLEVWEDDGSAGFRQWRERLKDGPIRDDHLDGRTPAAAAKPAGRKAASPRRK
ncbi:MAG: mandelate racemase/muconate lactonizing enzyme family protein [Planctomycetes bacterium]|nr:mandelate racemase/muconate lactonizing enzyme family protein [Planctomycetota bacterium]